MRWRWLAPCCPPKVPATPRFLAAALATWGWVMWRLWQDRAHNVPRDQPTVTPRPTLGWATGVTLFRSWLIALVAGHLFLPPVSGAGSLTLGLLYTAAALLDGVDGRVARRRGAVTRLGARLDVAADALGLLVVPLVAVRAGRLPPWYLLLALAYPLFRTALRLRGWRGRPVFPQRLRPDPRARFFAGVQMTVVATSFYPVVPLLLLWPAASVAMLPTLALFVREWRIVTGAVAPAELGPAAQDPAPPLGTRARGA